MHVLSERYRSIGNAGTGALLLALLAVVPAAAQTIAPNAGGTNFNTISRPAVESIGPADNTGASTARVIVPDGTSLFQAITPLVETRWFVFEAEPQKTYVVDVLDPYGDLNANVIGSVSVTNADGTTAPTEANTNCSSAATNRAPGLEVSTDGFRCIIVTNAPANGATRNKRGIYVGVGLVQGNQFQIRVRESTLYARWTTNAYDYHIELQNTTGDSMCARIVLNPSAGYTWTGATWIVPAGVQSVNLTVPAFGAIKTIFPNGTFSGGELRGTVRINDCGTGELVPNGLNVSTLGYNTNTGVYLVFTANKANQGGQNSW